ncbi:hypothetical protein GRX01_02325 [Halobaculum sp. WSA2]|uniref:Uncharacterized protein n=1 Tax=Halobaculum saliterrae TaxID=2073113 RepID=A0A6B0SN91_9EURY|nr:hypothetical protein [Halobaculum saliterrae]MXR40195.1 hypothetical protein [Halobaculum saliterrae]
MTGTTVNARILAVVVLVLADVASVGVASAGLPVLRDDSRTEQVLGRTGTDSIVVDGYDLMYDGTGASGITVYVNKSSDSLTADVAVKLLAANGTTVVRERRNDVLLANDPAAVTFEFDRPYGPGEFHRVKIEAAKSL